MDESKVKGTASNRPHPDIIIEVKPEFKNAQISYESWFGR